MTNRKSGDFLDLVERLANRVPGVAQVFLWLSLVVVIASVVVSLAGAEAIHPATGEAIRAKNLLGAEHIRRLLTEMPKTFTDFPPLGTVLTIMLGIGIADRSGLIGAAVGGFIQRAPARLLPFAVVFAGIMSSIAADAGFLIIPPLAAAIYAAAGRHPVAGVAAAYAGVSGGYSANLLITSLDPLLAGLTQAAAQIMDPALEVLATANWFMMAALVPLLSIGGAFVSTRIVEPRLGQWTAPSGFEAPGVDCASVRERRALRRTGWVAVALLAIILALTLPENAVLRDPETGSSAPFFQAIIAILTLSLGLLGLTYGYAAGTIRSSGDAVKMAERTVSDMALYIVIVFVAAHFIALFTWSNLGVLIAIGGGTLLQASGLGPGPLLVALILFCGLINLFITSASAKWALLAPIFVPMFMLVGLPPELTQGAYRVGDSFTNILAPTMVYLPLVLAVAVRYVPSFTLGRMIATMVPYAMMIFCIGTLLLLGFLALNLPLGPGQALASLQAPG
ncbi:MAG: AbgT family transporter [Gammaproteobacteria bacterium]|nr:MAG: AbgT family transporter [Gammaproteobacteria bacterium]